MKAFVLSLALIICTPLRAQTDTSVEFSSSDFADWYYKQSDAYQGWKYIVLHHSATQAGSVKAFHKYHTEQGYGGIAYHFVIGNGKGMNDGEVQETFRWKQQISGTHVTIHSWEYNVFGIGICLVGNFQKQKPTKAQLRALKKLIAKLKQQHDINTHNILGHNHVMHDDASGRTEQTACPGKKLELKKIN